MKNTQARSFGGWFRLSLLASMLALTPARAVIDLNNDGIGDIFAMKYNAAGLLPDGDEDNDGKSNRDEMIAGTDPRGGASRLAMASVTIDAAGLHISWKSVVGKQYVVQSAASLSPTPVAWLDVAPAAPISGTGEMLSRTYPAAAPGKFYRVVVQDMDSDHDGVTDWEEMMVGFDPNSSHSSGLSAVSDLAAITAALQATNVVTIVAADAAASEPATAALPASDTGAFVISRSGNLNAITVNYSVSGGATAGADYVPLSGSVSLPMGVNSATVIVTAKADAAMESPEAVIATLSASAAYTVGNPATAAVLINDFAQVNGTGLMGIFWEEGSGVLNQNTQPTFTGTPTPPVLYAGLNDVTASWATSSVRPAGLSTDGYWSSRWTGEVMPQFSQVYTFSLETNFAGRLYVNGQLVVNNWPPVAVLKNTKVSGTIELTGGVRYPIVVEHYQDAGSGRCYLRWQSLNRAEEFVPASRLFPNPAPQILSALEVLLLKNSPSLTYQIVASGNPTSYGAVNLPPGWSVNTVTGVISGVPTQEGIWNVPVTATNGSGSGSAILQIKVISTDGAISRDLWTGIAGTAVSAIPLDTTPTSTTALTSLETPQNAADDYGSRIRGHITAPATGVYKFWITASDTAELWISDDDDPVNAFLRAQVKVPTAFRGWTDANAGKSPLLWLVAGRKYYVEVRHKAGIGTDHLSVGWLKPNVAVIDPANVAAPEEVVPAYALSNYILPAPVNGESTLFTTSMGSQGNAITNGYGSASLRLSADETVAILSYDYANLTTPVTNQHIHADGYPSTSNIIFDIDDATPNPDGTYTWTIEATGTIGVPEIINVIKSGAAYINVHTLSYPNGEIRGNFRLAAASQTFTPPPLETWSDPNSASNPESALNPNGAARFLIQATFGPSEADIAAVQALGFEGWIDQQMNPAQTPIGYHFPEVYANRNQTDGQNGAYSGDLTFNTWWHRAVTSPDQLRQRVAFALSEIVVVSEDGPLDNRADALSTYYDLLLDHAFGNFLPLIESVTLHPAMGRYLDMLNNRKPNLAAGRIPNENYAREIKQLFTIGLNRMHPDGSLVLNSKGQIIPTYDQDEIIGFSHVFTGWTYHYTDVLNGRDPATYRTSNTGTSNWIDPMQPVPLEHYTGPKRLLNNVVLRGLPVIAGQPLDPNASHSSAQYNSPEYQQLARLELDAAHAALFNHGNAGPFICRQLIQRLVTSTPSRGYVYRTVQAFNGERNIHGVATGVRGDMREVIKAILLDKEARSLSETTQQGFGKQREPVVRVTSIARALPPPPPIVASYEQTGSKITVTTATPHLYTNNTSVFIEFGASTAGTPGAPLTATYSVTRLDNLRFTVSVKSLETATYVQGGAVTRLTTTGNGFYPNVGETIHVEYLTGALPLPVTGTDTIEYRSGDELLIVLAAPTAVRGSYGQTGTTITFNRTAHGFTAGSSVHIDFLTSSAASGLYTIASAAANSFTVTAAASATITGTQTAIAIPAADVLPANSGNANVTRLDEFATRSGPVLVPYGDWNMRTTDTDLNQTPLQSPTVFNFFVPDYQFPGLLAQAGLITPEFQLTSETSVIRQTNFIYNAIFTDTLSQSGLGSFKSGGKDVLVDLRPWIGVGPGGLPWVHNNNLNAFVDQMNTRLMAGQLPASAKTIIRNYAATLGYSSTPSTTQLRDRVRAVIHLMVTSPDFTIQK